ncbi:MAG: 3-dehydroquinate synthase [Planctomycetota bacterium]|jgi:3-dehydroquinate synthase
MKRMLQLDGTKTMVMSERGALARIGELVTHEIANQPAAITIITDGNLENLYLGTARASLESAGIGTAAHVIPAGETSKSIEQLHGCYEAFAKHGLDRDGLVLALGGGVVSDLAGFAAGTWMRGVDFAICPTTLEADIDAAIGGKTGINLAFGKNLAGLFHQPQLVAVDPDLLATLPDREFAAALAESIKHALISSESFLEWHDTNADAIVGREPEIVAELVCRNIEIKASFVENDAREQTGSRIMLNFGHTIGHAIESNAGYQLRHGECVALGILVALQLSVHEGMIVQGLCDRVRDLMIRLQLPVDLKQSDEIEWVEKMSFKSIATTMAHDKKFKAGNYRFVLLRDIGEPIVSETLTADMVQGAYEGII